MGIGFPTSGACPGSKEKPLSIRFAVWQSLFMVSSCQDGEYQHVYPLVHGKKKATDIMKNIWILLCVATACSATAGTVRVIEDFEYADAEELLLDWEPSTGAIPSLSTEVAAGSEGATSMQVDLSFPSAAWVTQSITGPLLNEVF